MYRLLSQRDADLQAVEQERADLDNQVPRQQQPIHIIIRWMQVHMLAAELKAVRSEQLRNNERVQQLVGDICATA